MIYITSFGALVVNQFMISLLRKHRKKGQPRDNYIISLFNSNIITQDKHNINVVFYL